MNHSESCLCELQIDEKTSEYLEQEQKIVKMFMQ